MLNVEPSTFAPADERLRLVDVGGAGGLQEKWVRVAGQIVPVLFEPSPSEAAPLRSKIAQQFSGGLVLETGLSNLVGPQTLNVARFSGCSSLRQPNADVLSRYRIAAAFDVVGKQRVTCTRYDELFRQGAVPAPDAIKVDVQGAEYEVLLGFGTLLQGCLGIELETHVYPLYRGQRLLGDMVAFLADFGFVLRGLKPVPSFDGDIVELDAWFTKEARIWRTFDAVQKRKHSLLCQVWDLVDYTRIKPGAHHNQIEPAA